MINQREIYKMQASIKSLLDAPPINSCTKPFIRDWGSIDTPLLIEASIPVSNVHGTASAITPYIGILGQILYNTDTKTLHAMDGITPGGSPLLKSSDAYLKTQTYTKEEVDTAVGGISFDTSLLATKAQVLLKVDKVEGKGLSSNDYTTAEKEKVAEVLSYNLSSFIGNDWGNINTDHTTVSIASGLKSEVLNFLGIQGQLVYATDSKEVYVMDGTTQGGALVSVPITRVTALEEKVIDLESRIVALEPPVVEPIPPA